MENPFDATLEEFAAENYTHIECFWSRCPVTRLRPISWFPASRLGLPSRSCLSGGEECAATRDVFGQPLGAEVECPNPSGSIAY